MSVILTVIATVVIAVAIGTTRNKPINPPETTPTPSLAPTESPQPSSSPEDLPSPIPEGSTEPTTTPVPSGPADTGDQDFIYPGSQVVIQTSSEIRLKSFEDTDVITDWYKEKLRDLGYNVNSFVTTQTNGYVENKLVSASGVSEVKVDIIKQQDTSLVTIVITL